MNFSVHPHCGLPSFNIFFVLEIFLFGLCIFVLVKISINKVVFLIMQSI